MNIIGATFYLFSLTADNMITFFNRLIVQFKKLHTIAFLIAFLFEWLKWCYYFTVARYTLNTNMFAHVAVYLDVLVTIPLLVVSGPMLNWLLSSRKGWNAYIILLITAASALHFVWAIVLCIIYWINIYHSNQAWSVGHVFTNAPEYGAMLGIGLIAGSIFEIGLSAAKTFYSLTIFISWGEVLLKWETTEEEEEFKDLVVSGKIWAPKALKNMIIESRQTELYKE